MSIRYALLLIAVSLAWAAEYLFISRGGTGLRPLELSTVLLGVGGGVMFVIVRLGLGRPLLPAFKESPFLILFLSVTAMIIPTLGTTVAEERIDPDIAALVGTTVPIATFFLTAIMTKSGGISLVRLAGVALAVLGIAVFIGLHDGGHIRAEFIGVLIMSSGGVVFAFSGVIAGTRANHIDALVLATWIMLLAAVMLAVTCVVVHGQPAEIESPTALAWAVAGGVFSVGLAYAGYYVLIQRTSAFVASLYAYIVPVFGFGIGVLADHEPVTANRLIGIALVLAGLALTVGRQKDAQGTEANPADQGVAPAPSTD